MRITFVLLLILGNYFSHAQEKQVCFTIDDLPVVSYSINDTVYQEALTRKLLSKLNAAKIPALGFVNETKLYPNGVFSKFQRKLLTLWVDHGLELGNHTYSHADYNNTPFEKYTTDILKGDVITREVMRSRKKELIYFRHPYLHTGYSQAKSDSLNAFLTGKGYTVAPVTIDNADYLFAAAYHRAKIKKDTALMARIGKDYIIYMENVLHYFEKQSVALFGRNIRHIQLLHANALNADYIDALAAMYVRNSYTFISLTEALKDKAYQHPVTRFGKWGISWIDRWALSEGKSTDFFKGEPETPAYIIELSESR